MLASQEGHMDIVQYLVQQGASLDIQNQVHYTDIDITCIWICRINDIITLVEIGWKNNSIDIGIK